MRRPAKARTGTCELSISRPTCGDGHEEITVTITDDLSRCIVAELHVSLSAFMKALTAHSQQGIPCEWGNLELIGLRREHKTIEVEVGDGPWTEKKKRAAEAAAVFEVDGWRIGFPTDFGNMHRWSHDKVAVTYERWVDPNVESPTVSANPSAATPIPVTVVAGPDPDPRRRGSTI